MLFKPYHPYPAQIVLAGINTVLQEEPMSDIERRLIEEARDSIEEDLRNDTSIRAIQTWARDSQSLSERAIRLANDRRVLEEITLIQAQVFQSLANPELWKGSPAVAASLDLFFDAIANLDRTAKDAVERSEHILRERNAS